MVDDQLRILTAMKEVLRERLTTVFPRRGCYDLDQHILSAYPPADRAPARIGDLADCDFSGLTRLAKLYDGKQETR